MDLYSEWTFYELSNGVEIMVFLDHRDQEREWWHAGDKRNVITANPPCIIETGSMVDRSEMLAVSERHIRNYHKNKYDS